MSDEYNRLGVDRYYELHARDYRNVHFPEIVTAVRVLMNTFQQRGFGHSKNNNRISVLDLACGSGEATLALKAWQRAHRASAPETQQVETLQVDGADPFTGPAYEERTGQTAASYSFDDVAGGCLTEKQLEYDLCVCSFAMHLLQDKSSLWCTLSALARSCNFLALLSPHKKPEVAPSSGWQLEYESVQERVRIRLFRSTLRYVATLPT